jgi:predicted amidohydrolase
MSAKERAFLLFDVVNLIVRCASHTGITTFIIAAVAGHGNLQYYYIGMLSYITLKFSNIGIISVITVVLAGLGKLQYYHIEML